MPEKKNKKKTEEITRREFIKKTGMVGVAVGAGAIVPAFRGKAFAAKKRDYILIGRPNPHTGKLADFGHASPWVDKKAAAEINRQGGIYIEEYGKSLPVKFKILDTESDPSKTAELTARLIVNEKVDLILALHTNDTVNPADAICERYKVPCISADATVEPWLTGGPYYWSHHAFWTVSRVIDLFIGMWAENIERTNRVVGGLWGNDTTGVTWAKIFKERLPGLGFRVIDPGRFPFGTKDFTTIINQFKKEKVDILTGNMPPPVWATVWRQCRRMGFVPKIATIDKAILFPSAVEALGGDLGLGLTSEIWWSDRHPFKSSLTGETSRELCDSWVKETGEQWVQPLGFKHAVYEIAFDALKRAKTLEKEKLRNAIAQTELNTIVGPIKYNDRNYSETPLVGGQWSKGKKWPWEMEIVYNKEHPEIAKTGELLFPIPS